MTTWELRYYLAPAILQYRAVYPLEWNRLHGTAEPGSRSVATRIQKAKSRAGFSVEVVDGKRAGKRNGMRTQSRTGLVVARSAQKRTGEVGRKEAGERAGRGTEVGVLERTWVVAKDMAENGVLRIDEVVAGEKTDYSA